MLNESDIEKAVLLGKTKLFLSNPVDDKKSNGGGAVKSIYFISKHPQNSRKMVADCLGFDAQSFGNLGMG